MTKIKRCHIEPVNAKTDIQHFINFCHVLNYNLFNELV